jgi:phage internal scaffolding protein
MALNPKVRNRFSKRVVVISPTGEGRAQQQFKDDADINSIMRKFQRTGAIEHTKEFQDDYNIATGQTLHEAMNLVTQAQTMFMALPSSVRARFDQDPTKFLDFVQDDKNIEEARKLGLVVTQEAPEIAITRMEAPGAPTSENAPKTPEGSGGEGEEVKT